MFKIFLLIVFLIAFGAFYWRRRKAKSVVTARGATPAFDEFLASKAGLIPQGVMALLIAVVVFNTSDVNPGPTQVGIFNRTYLCKPITDGRNIALEGECGRQAKIYMPGFKWWDTLLINVLGDVEYVSMVNVPDGRYAMLSARDGLKLDDGQVAARPWPIGKTTFVNKDNQEVTGDMLDATFFLGEGKGQKGPQATILPPGLYPINTYLLDVQVDKFVEHVIDENGKDLGRGLSRNFTRKTIPTGFVGVVKSAIDESTRPAFVSKTAAAANCGKPLGKTSATTAQMKAVLVPVGSRGVWNEALPPGDYFINKNIYDVELHDTRMQNLVLAGGYTRRVIDLVVNDKGDITQQAHEEIVEQPKIAVGPAVPVKTEGWTVWQELRIQFRTKPECAPLQAAALGSLKEVEDRIIVPQAISVLRNIGGSNIKVKNTIAYEEAKSELSALKARLDVLKDANADVGLNPEQRNREIAALEKQIAGLILPNPEDEVTRPTRVLDFQNERESLEKLVAIDIQKIGDEAGTEIDSVTFGNPDIPPELLVARKVEQLSGQLRNAYTQMRTAQVQRQATEAARARAEKQADLVTASIDLEKSKLKIETRENDGIAERKYNENDAKGQQAQVNVLGADKVMTIRIANTLIEALTRNPEIISGIKLPSTMVFGSSGLDGPAAIFRGAFGSNDNQQAQPPTVAAKR